MTEHAHKQRQALSMTTILGFCVWYCHTSLNQLRVIFWCSHANLCQACRFLCVYLPYKFPQVRSVKKHRLAKSHKVNTTVTEPTETRSITTIVEFRPGFKLGESCQHWSHSLAQKTSFSQAMLANAYRASKTDTCLQNQLLQMKIEHCCYHKLAM